MTTIQTHSKSINPSVTGKRRSVLAAAMLVALGGLALGTSAPAMAHPKKKAHEEKKEDRKEGKEEKGGWHTAQLTTYTSYPRCCKGSPAYDPHASKEECEDYSGCKYQGEFAAIGKKSFEWVKDNAVVAFYDNADKQGREFNKKYGGKKIRLRKNGKEFTAVIADTCGNSDCDDCCIKNSKGGFLVDMEFWTAQRNIGGANKAEGTIEFQILD
ncbi:MAG TPA: hypothetical protein VF516_35415 [Kofleriaceae bacterium]